MERCRTDKLTGLGNYLAFREYVGNLVALGVAFSVILFDMTNLKAANEALGHFGADVLLANVGGMIRKGADHVFRHGGDEFAIVLACAPTGGALKVRDRIEEQVGVSYLRCGSMVRIVGEVGTWVPDLDLDHTLNQIDKALERRKAKVKCSAGRNRELASRS
jgi:diguanylate cyclase (GGDEF)-like protein